MAKILSGILSSPSGKVSGVVGGSWKGIAYLRGYAIPANPNTVEQQGQRSKFRTAQSLAGLLLNTVVQKFWDYFARGQSGYNAFISKNLLSMATDVDYPNTFIANGKLEICPINSAQYSGITGEVAIIYDDQTYSNGLADDTVVLCVWDTVNNVVFVNDTGLERGTTEGTVNVGLGRIVDNMWAFCFAYRGLGTKEFIVSPSTVTQTAV